MPWSPTPTATSGPVTSAAGVATITYSATSIGAWLIIYVMNGGGVATPTITDTLGNTWYNLGNATRTTICRTDILATYVQSTSSNTITITSTGAGTSMYAYLEEWFGGVSGTDLTKSVDAQGILYTSSSTGAAATATGTVGGRANPAGGSGTSDLNVFAVALNGSYTSPAFTGGTLGGQATRGFTGYSIVGNRATFAVQASWVTSRQFAFLIVPLIPAIGMMIGMQ